MKTFSQRKGLKPVSETIQIDSMTDALRNSLWNALDVSVWRSSRFLFNDHGPAGIKPFSRDLWFRHFKKPIDSRPDNAHKILAEIRAYFFDCEWYEVYDFLEFLVGNRVSDDLVTLLNAILEQELSGYRFVGKHLTDITTPQELASVEAALGDSRFAGVSAHIEQALTLYADRENPDYRNSIKESISAVESMARVVSGDDKATLGERAEVSIELVEHGRRRFPDRVAGR